MTPDDAWAIIRALADRARADHPVTSALAARLDGATLVEADPSDAAITIDPGAAQGWRHARPIEAPAARLLDLYVPLCVGDAATDLVVAHLAQSLDGRIATASGASQFISGQEDVEHAHRMRALFDAVVVGAETVARDDPRLTTRLVPGEHATRVVVDPRGRLPARHALFQDGLAPTLVVRRATAGLGARHGQAEIVPVEAAGDVVSAAAIRRALAGRGLRRLFIEGGGVTVSRFLAAGEIDRLQVVVAPCILGSGRPAFTLPPIDQLSEAMSLACRHVAFGPDVLFDCVVGRR